MQEGIIDLFANVVFAKRILKSNYEEVVVIDIVKAWIIPEGIGIIKASGYTTPTNKEIFNRPDQNKFQRRGMYLSFPQFP